MVVPSQFAFLPWVHWKNWLESQFRRVFADDSSRSWLSTIGVFSMGFFQVVGKQCQYKAAGELWSHHLSINEVAAYSTESCPRRSQAYDWW
jgi:hypothetical protein